MSRVLPILFNGDMVRAILDGRKTATRRCVKLPKYIKAQDDGLYILFAEGTCYENQHMEEIVNYLNPPYQPGDTLYVRETWCWCPCWDCGMDTEDECCDKTAERFYHPEKHEYGCYGYKASFDMNEEPFDKWYPSIHMPKEAARIWLKVKDMRVERLQEITVNGLQNEGVLQSGYISQYAICSEKIFSEFKELWNSTIKKSDIERYGWDANPLVWVIEFEKCEKPE